MSPKRFKHLLTMVKSELEKDSQRREVITAAERLAICLRYLATGYSQQTQSFNFRIGRSTVSKIVNEVCAALWDKLSPEYLKMPSTMEEWQHIAQEFEEQLNFPNVLGAIGGKHIAIECPKFGGSSYYNCIKFHSTVLMAMCDAGYRFTFVDIGSYGSDNDASILNRTAFFQDLEDGSLPIPPPRNIDDQMFPYTFIGDEIFPLRTWLMKPYPGKNLSHEQRAFNYRLSRSRRTIENAFGIMTSRWRIFGGPIRANVETVDIIVKATMCLHNYLPYTDTDNYSSDGTITRGMWRQEGAEARLANIVQQGSNIHTISAKQTRDNWCHLLNSANHKLSYQDDLIRNCGHVLNK